MHGHTLIVDAGVAAAVLLIVGLAVAPTGPRDGTPGGPNGTEAAADGPGAERVQHASIQPSAATLPPASILFLSILGFVAGRRFPWSQPGDREDHGKEPEDDPLPEPEDVPGGVPGLLLMGRRATQHGNLANAARWFETAIALAPRTAQAHTCLGVVLLGEDRCEEAAESLGHAVDLDPGDAVARYHLAKALARLDRHREALHHIAPLVRTDPEMAEAIREEDAFQALRDHPLFLDLTGDLSPGAPSRCVVKTPRYR